MSVRESLTKMVNVATKVDLIVNAMRAAGFRSETPYDEILGEITDAVYCLLDEHTFDLDQSVTYYALFCDPGSTERKVDLLMAEYERNKNAVFEPA